MSTLHAPTVDRRSIFAMPPAELSTAGMGTSPLDAATRFALLQSRRGCDKPLLCASLHSLAARLLAERGDLALRLEDQALHLEGETAPRQVVAVYTQLDHGSDQGFLGYAWLGGYGRRVLEAALYAQEPNPAARAVRGVDLGRA